MLKRYDVLYPLLRDKTRGRKHSANVIEAPECWAELRGDDPNIYVTHKHLTVAVLHPDNSMEIDIHGWHTQVSVNIIEGLTGHVVYLSKGHIWYGDYPYTDKIRLNAIREHIPDPACVALGDDVVYRIGLVSLDDLPAKHRMMYEMGTWKPSPAITERVMAYALGEADKSTLSPRDILTCIDQPYGIETRCLERRFA